MIINIIDKSDNYARPLRQFTATEYGVLETVSCGSPQMEAPDRKEYVNLSALSADQLPFTVELFDNTKHV